MGEPTRCPRCSEPPVRTDKVRETTQAGFGVVGEPQIVERATCKNNHFWFARDEPKDGESRVRGAGIGRACERGACSARTLKSLFSRLATIPGRQVTRLVVMTSG
jgi:hypothetical protein